MGKQSSLQVLKVHDKSLVGSFHQFDLSLSFKASPNNQMTIVNLYLQSMADAFYWDTGFRGCVSNTPWKIWERWIWGLGMPSKKATQPGTSPPSFSLAILLLKLKQRHFLVDVSVLVLSFPECMASKKGK